MRKSKRPLLIKGEAPSPTKTAKRFKMSKNEAIRIQKIINEPEMIELSKRFKKECKSIAKLLAKMESKIRKPSK